MSLDVLEDRSQIEIARKELVGKGVSFLEPAWRSILRRFGISPVSYTHLTLPTNREV